MSIINDMNRLLQPIKNRIYLVIGRAILTAVDNSGGTVKLTIKGLSGETLSEIEYIRDYGFESYPLSDAECLTLSINGNRELATVARVHDRRHRPKYLSEGEVCIYTSEDSATGGHRIHFKTGQKIDVQCVDATLTCTTASVTASTSAYVDSPDVKLGNTASVEKLAKYAIKAALNAHKHSGITIGADETGAVTAGTQFQDTHFTTETQAS